MYKRDLDTKPGGRIEVEVVKSVVIMRMSIANMDDSLRLRLRFDQVGNIWLSIEK